MYLYVCMYINTYIRTYVYVYVHTCRIDAYSNWTEFSLLLHMYIHTYIHICKHIHNYNRWMRNADGRVLVR